METTRPRRTLIVANLTASTPLLAEEVERRAGERPTEFALLIPNVSSRKAADWTLETALKVLRRAASGPQGQREAHVDGLVGGADPFESIKQTLADGSYDDVVISTLPKRRSEWLKKDLPSRVQQLNVVPVTVITEPEDTRSLQERVTDNNFPTLPMGGFPSA
jgi:hypothetical protein